MSINKEKLAGLIEDEAISLSGDHCTDFSFAIGEISGVQVQIRLIDTNDDPENWDIFEVRDEYRCIDD